MAALYGVQNVKAVEEFLLRSGAALERLKHAAANTPALIERCVAEVRSWHRADFDTRVEVSNVGHGSTLAVQYISAIALRSTAGPVAAEIVAGWHGIATATSADTATDAVVRLTSAAFCADVRRRVVNAHVVDRREVDGEARRLTLDAFPFSRGWLAAAAVTSGTSINMAAGDSAAKLVAMAQAPPATGADAGRL